MAEKRASKKGRRLAFEIRTAKPLSVGEQVFVTGNHEMLGRWKPDAFPLTRMADLVWQGTATVPNTEDVEYKVTRGSWDTEEVTAAGILPSNSRVKSGGDQVIRHEVAAWRDDFHS